MKRLGILALLVFMPSLAHAWPWSRDMMNQPSIKPQEGPMRPFPARSEPVAGTTVRVADRDAAEKLPNPIAPTAESVNKGRQLFTIYCTPCHGSSGRGDGRVGAKLILKPFNLADQERMSAVKDGYIFGMMTFGGAVMPPYANDLSATERWHVVNYVRHGLVNAPRDPALDVAADAKKGK